MTLGSRDSSSLLADRAKMIEYLPLSIELALSAESVHEIVQRLRRLSGSLLDQVGVVHVLPELAVLFEIDDNGSPLPILINYVLDPFHATPLPQDAASSIRLKVEVSRAEEFGLLDLPPASLHFRARFHERFSVLTRSLTPASRSCRTSGSG